MNAHIQDNLQSRTTLYSINFHFNSVLWLSPGYEEVGGAQTLPGLNQTRMSPLAASAPTFLHHTFGLRLKIVNFGKRKTILRDVIWNNTITILFHHSGILRWSNVIFFEIFLLLRIFLATDNSEKPYTTHNNKRWEWKMIVCIINFPFKSVVAILG